MTSIKFEHVTKRYKDGFEAVREMSLAVRDGEFMILVGPSGSGKSTALRMVAGLEEIADGELRIGGAVVNDRAPKDQSVAGARRATRGLGPRRLLRTRSASAHLDVTARRVAQACRTSERKGQVDDEMEPT